MIVKLMPSLHPAKTIAFSEDKSVHNVIDQSLGQFNVVLASKRFDWKVLGSPRFSCLLLGTAKLNAQSSTQPRRLQAKQKT